MAQEAEAGEEGQAAEGPKEKKPRAAGGMDNEYDYGDDWIDDSEFVSMYEGDRRKTKFKGFFINKVSRVGVGA